MNNKLIKSLISAAVLVALSGCSDSDKAPVEETCGDDNCIKFTILHTNDNHGRFWESKYGEYGMAARKTLIQQIRDQVASEGGHTLLLSGGDINTGVPESDLQNAEPDFKGMNLLEYDAMAVGNHEFDNALDVMDKQRDWSNFPWLAANIYKTELDEQNNPSLARYFDAYKIFNLGSLKVAVIGLITEDTATIGNPQIVGELTFTDPKEEMLKVITELEANEKPDIILATTHMGHYENGNPGSNAPGDIALAKALEQGQLQAIFGGHSQNPVCMEPGTDNYADFKPGDECLPDQQNGTYIMQAHEWGKYVGQANFEYFGGELHLASYKLIPVNLKVKDENGDRILVGNEIKQDPIVKEFLRPFKEQGQEELDITIASTDAAFERGQSDMQIDLGHLLAKANMVTDGANYDIGVMNSGGIRAGIEAGEITYRDVLTVQPFGNDITVSDMTGAELTEYLGVVASIQVGSGGYAQLAGVKMTVDCMNSSVEISDIAGKGFSSDATYTITVPSYSASGGDSYPVLTPRNTGVSDAKSLRDFLEAKGHINSGEFTPNASDILYTNSEITTGCKLSQ
ncbi:bifunctional UDP-sugar hydrolase/5'-nucleotidase UshA [Shewanella eurypsychrophilus]|uniref:Bifunctional UDP-sugar hydrolase/5'-nucleotidase UshA n=1 Tax=Shewanella eurypsychrophilus TaxID=2593656 RepID=A0ABX6V916_9GAMM|nr:MULTISPECIES: bifunctional UDP-sugar hydrolase/5'-nucleotidase UshA [Shewanella]QFU23798.1 bifunctional UDP-sugar hydrolase/5'-nucleotidase [Shewanella sp. YLB-09]QPG59021.2 bifunctional UDP-sugar hydrolase/5'-nucleotidase UshA [Shewanella eurypsychrophilus]